MDSGLSDLSPELRLYRDLGVVWRESKRGLLTDKRV